jgi:hypothetical protein
VKLTKYQNHHHHRDVFDMWTKWARPWAEWAQGLTGRLNSLASQPAFEAVKPEPWLPHDYTRRGMPSWWRKSVEAAPPGRPTMWFGHPASTWCQTILSKSVELPFTPINTPLTVKVNTPHSTCSSPLVKVPV